MLRTSNLIIGNNKRALESAKEKAESFGYEARIITNKLSGDINDVAGYILESINLVKYEESDKKICLLFGGEPTIILKGNGLGGRNQHLALIIAKSLENLPGITFLSGGTDGTDGSTNASNLNLSMDQYIANCDSYHFFKQVGGLIRTGPTQTNVMDLMIALIDKY